MNNYKTIPIHKESIYRQNGYDSRAVYLQALADEYGQPLEIVDSLAGLLGPNEDFDGLVSSLEDLRGS